MNYNQLKLIAIITMFIDHFGIMINSQLFRHIGRISFVIFAFLISNGIKHTKDKRIYIRNLFIFAFISEPFFDYFILNGIYNGMYSYSTIAMNFQNVFFTLGCGALSCYFYDMYLLNKKYVYLIITSILMPILIRSDYSLYGALFIFLFYLCKYNKSRFLIAMLFAVLQYGLSKYYIHMLFTFIGAYFIYLYNDEKGKNYINKYVFYIFYPFHMYILTIMFYSS